MSKQKEGVGKSKNVRGVLELHIIPKYMQGRGVKTDEHFADIIYGWPLMRASKMKFLLS